MTALKMNLSDQSVNTVIKENLNPVRIQRGVVKKTITGEKESPEDKENLHNSFFVNKFF